MRPSVPWATVSLVLYLVSLVVPAVVFESRPLFGGGGHEQLWPGIGCLELGWVALPWYANIALLVAAITYLARRPRAAQVFAASAFGLALTSFCYLGDDLVALHVGFYLWLASMAALFVAAGQRRRAPERTSLT